VTLNVNLGPRACFCMADYRTGPNGEEEWLALPDVLVINCTGAVASWSNLGGAEVEYDSHGIPCRITPPPAHFGINIR
jgi:hypothetical protein